MITYAYFTNILSHRIKFDSTILIDNLLVVNLVTLLVDNLVNIFNITLNIVMTLYLTKL